MKQCAFFRKSCILFRFFSRAVLPRAGVALDSTYMGRPHCAQVFPVALAAGDAPVRDIALRALVAGDAMGQDLPHDGASRLLQGSGDCAEPPVRTQTVPCLGTVGQGQTWHGIVLLSHGGLPCPIARLNAPLPPEGGVSRGSQAMHSPVWIEAWTIRLPDDTTPVELNAHPMFCTIQRTKRVRLTFPVTLYDDEGEDCTCCGSSDIYFADGK